MCRLISRSLEGRACSSVGLAAVRRGAGDLGPCAAADHAGPTPRRRTHAGAGPRGGHAALVLRPRARCAPQTCTGVCVSIGNTAQHSTAHHSTAQHGIAQHSTAQHSTAQHSTVQQSTANQSTVQCSAVITGSISSTDTGTGNARALRLVPSC